MSIYLETLLGRPSHDFSEVRPWDTVLNVRRLRLGQFLRLRVRDFGIDGRAPMEVRKFNLKVISEDEVTTSPSRGLLARLLNKLFPDDFPMEESPSYRYHREEINKVGTYYPGIYEVYNKKDQLVSFRWEPREPIRLHLGRWW